LTLSGDLSDAQRRRLLEIADRCPVHRTLESDLRISTELANERSSSNQT
jgi:putative redox protein